jgi:competence protein ComEC
MLVQLPGGEALLFDAGSRRGGRVGAYAIVPALWRQGVRKLDLVCVSHGDADHYNGVLDVIERIPVGRLVLAEGFGRSAKADPSLALFLERLEARGIAAETVRRSDRILLAHATADVLWPPKRVPFADRIRDNELSLVLRITSPHGAVLLTGDIERYGASRLLGAQRDLSADVAQVPHHGLRNPRGVQLLKRVRPAVALVPGGRYMAADSEYADCTGRLMSTFEYGMMTVTLRHGEIVAIETFLK